jgi:phenylacetate-coenzyme A ligase PaaK-like adenylate-forming protein
MSKTPCISSLEWEHYNIEERDKIIFGLLKKQFQFNKKNVPFYKKFYKNIDELSLNGYSSSIAQIPVLTKSILKNINSPYEFINEETFRNLRQVYLHRGTGGTTGRPTSVFYSNEDWRAALYASNRLFYPRLNQDFNSDKVIAFNNYNQGHIAGAIFNYMVQDLNGLAINRNFNSTDEEALKQICYHRCNLIISPPISTSKGGTIESLLAIDAATNTNYVNGDNIKYLFLSSTNLTPDLYEELVSLGIKNIFCFYGSTEILPIAISCENDPFKFHFIEGHIYANAINSNHELVANGERGMLIAGRIASVTNDGNIVPAQANTFMNYLLGDEVTLSTENCSCGRTTRSITNIERKLDIDYKISSGCQTW